MEGACFPAGRSLRSTPPSAVESKLPAPRIVPGPLNLCLTWPDITVLEDCDFQF
jgi:hypothetical protein